MAFNDRNSRGNSGGFRGNSGPREMHTAVCSDCNVETQVPFKPDPERPVYCRDCLPNHRTPRENRY
ncbi:MAG: CxxC-x17-CxxC domain-containing protein [Methanosarcina sp.]|jgi:CxxC-x17-CxxC domain-containing protein